MSNFNFVNISIFILFITLKQTYGNNVTSNLHIKINETSSSTTKNIPTEGGMVIVSDKNRTKPENTLLKPTVNNSTATNTSVHNETISRNKVVKTTSTVASAVTTTLKINVPTTTTEKIIPVSEAEAPLIVNVTNNQSSTTEKLEITGDSKIKPRKGAPEYIPENVTSTTKKPRKMKPTVTIGSDDDGKVIFNGHKNSKGNSSIFKPDGILSGRYRPEDYVLPIVMTILAVPLLAILLTVLYKRGSEWWQHRHYRRMDFLIDGMYNN